jgi:hypothetical protein
MKVKPVSIARSIHKTSPMISACMNTDTTSISHQPVGQKKAELAAIPRSPEDGQYDGKPNLGDTNLKLEGGGEVDDEMANGDEQLSNLRCTVGEFGNLSKKENETRKPFKIENLEFKLENKNLKMATLVQPLGKPHHLFERWGKVREICRSG